MQQLELLVTSNNTGQLFDCSTCATSIQWETQRVGNPGKLTFTVVKSGALDFVEGDTVRLTVDNQLQFFGWVFSKSKNRWGVIDVTCYDRVRYLKANASYAFYATSAAGVIRQIAEDFRLDVSDLEDTKYLIPSMIEENQSCIDIIGTAVQKTLLNTGKIYVFYDNGKGLCLKSADSLKSNVILGDKSYLTNYTYKTDIDTQTYNYVKLARPNEETGRTDVFIAEDSGHIAEWGLLQLYEPINGDLNDAQAKAQAETTLTYYNRRLRTLSCSALGIVGLRAGMLIRMQISQLGDINLNQWVLLEKVTHKWTNGNHTMSFETKAI